MKNCLNKKRDISDIVITTDSSKLGWGAVCSEQEIGGRWFSHESMKHTCINYLELKAVEFALKAFCKDQSNVHVQIKFDNTSAIAYINSMGCVKSSDLNELAKSIWLWCIDKNIWLSAAFVPGIENSMTI